MGLVGADTVAAMRVRVAAELGCGVNGDSDVDLLNGDLVHDSVLGVGGGRDDLALGGSSLLNDRRGGDGGCGRCSVGLGGCGRCGVGLDVVHGDTATPLVGDLGPGRGVRLRWHRCGRGGDGDGHGRLVSITNLEGLGVLGAELDGDVSAKAVRGTIAVVVVEAQNLGRLGLDLAGALLSLGLEVGCEVDAVLDAARWVGAVVDSSLQNVGVPAVDEISVVSVS
jgi:hypothetical protein